MKSFKDMTEYEEDTLMIVDSLNLAFRYKHKGTRHFYEDYMRTVDSLRKSYKAGKVVIAADSGSSSYRKELYPEYKLQRKEKAEASSEEEQEAFRLFFSDFMDTIEKYKLENKYPVIQFPKVEADDIAGYIVKNKEKYGLKKIILVSSDRDWDLLVIDDSVLRFSYVTRKEVTLENWSESYPDWSQYNYIDIKCLMGDSGDNIPGVDKIGPVKAKELVNKYGSVYDVAAALPINSKYVYINNLNKFGADNLLRNLRLMDLYEYCDEALGSDNCKEIDKVLEEYLNVE